jgi:hypothetical protein
MKLFSTYFKEISTPGGGWFIKHLFSVPWFSLSRGSAKARRLHRTLSDGTKPE